MPSSNIILILGAGGRVGASVASHFSKNGWSVAIAARSLEDDKLNADGFLQIKLDVADPEAVKPAFEKVKKKFGGWPSVVVYNAAALHFVSATDPLVLSADDLQHDLTINTTSVLAAAQQAVAGFAELPPETMKTFIYTGNFLNSNVLPPMLSLGVGKAATSHLIQVAAEAYKDKAYRFYYADERAPSGFAANMDLNGPNHAKHYWTLAESEQLPWLQTFVGGKGYVDFSQKQGDSG